MKKARKIQASAGPQRDRHGPIIPQLSIVDVARIVFAAMQAFSVGGATPGRVVAAPARIESTCLTLSEPEWLVKLIDVKGKPGFEADQQILVCDPVIYAAK